METTTENFTHTALALLDTFTAQRPGIEPGNYGSFRDYRAESRSVTRDLHVYRTIRGSVHWRTFTLAQWQDAFRRAFSGRLTLSETPEGWRLDYCTGQYFPTEYRRAACAVLASLLWDYARRENFAGLPWSGNQIRATFRKQFGRAIAGRYFD